jgi:hypothetical protein
VATGGAIVYRPGDMSMESHGGMMISAGKLLIRPPELSGNPPVQLSSSKQDEWVKE